MPGLLLAIEVMRLQYFDHRMTLEQATKKRRQLARQYHPDQYPEHAGIMEQINAEFQTLKDYLTKPQPVPFQVNTSNPNSYWAAVVGSAKTNVATMPQQPTQQAGRAAQAAAPPSPGYTASPQPTPPQPTPPAPAPAPTPPPARSRPAPVATLRSATPRAVRPVRASVATAEHRDYELALSEPPNKDGLRIYGRVAIIWQDRSAAGDLIVVNDVRVGNYRLQIRVNGEVKEEFPLSRSWKSERASAIAHAKSQYL